MCNRITATIQHAVYHYAELLQEDFCANAALAEVSRIYGFAESEIQAGIDAVSTAD